MFLALGLLLCSVAAFPTESPQYDSKQLAQNYNREQVVRAYYISGDRLNMIKIKIADGKVIQYANGKNNGRDFWVSAGNADIMRTQFQYDGELAQEFQYKACISTMFARVLWIYF